MIKTETEFKDNLRDVMLLEQPPIQEKNGRWRVNDRLETWKIIAPRIFDEYLDRFSKVAREVLSEIDPQIELSPDERHMSDIYGKKLTHSRDLRNGIAETLALIGSFPNLLTAASTEKREYLSYSIVHSVLSEADWTLWVSLNDVMPLLAEASPEAFLDALEAALASDNFSTFGDVFSQEGRSFTARTYVTGLLWGLELLAWAPDYLVRVIMILGALTERDPGGKYSNRPSNSTATILLPWFPQTTAPVHKRISAVKTLAAEFPTVAWNLLLELLPTSRQFSSTTHKPRFRSFIPLDWKEGVNNDEFRQQTKAYSDLAISLAQFEPARLAILIERFNQLPPDQQKRLLNHLNSADTNSFSESEQLNIWEALIDFAVTHTRYSQAEWAVSKSKILKINKTSRKFQPDSLPLRFRHLFRRVDFDLYGGNDDWKVEQVKLEKKRVASLRKVYRSRGIDGIIKMAEIVESPEKVGAALEKVAYREIESQILPELLVSDSVALLNMTAGYVWAKFIGQRWEWFDALDTIHWPEEQKAQILAFLPSSPEVWFKAENLLGVQSDLYWKKTNPNAFDLKGEDLNYAVDRLLNCGRHIAAASLLTTGIYTKVPLDSRRTIKVIDSLSSDEIESVGGHDILELIKSLQHDEATDQDALRRIEWRFLGLLDGLSGGRPITLETAMSESPPFFCEVVQIAFRSDRQDDPGRKSSISPDIALNAYRLLDRWRIPPGTKPDGDFDGGALKSWVKDVRKIAQESGHLVIALQQIGKVLFYVPDDPDGLWIHRSAAEVLNPANAKDARIGYRVEIFNSRGVHFVDPEGSPERALANTYRDKADKIENAGYHRIATTLREVASEYDREAYRLIERHGIQSGQ